MSKFILFLLRKRVCSGEEKFPLVFEEGRGGGGGQTFPPARQLGWGLRDPSSQITPPPHTLLSSGSSFLPALLLRTPPKNFLCASWPPSLSSCPLPRALDSPGAVLPLRTQTGNRPQSGQHLKPHFINTIKDQRAHVGLGAPKPASRRKPCLGGGR